MYLCLPNESAFFFCKVQFYICNTTLMQQLLEGATAWNSQNIGCSMPEPGSASGSRVHEVFMECLHLVPSHSVIGWCKWGAFKPAF